MDLGNGWPEPRPTTELAFKLTGWKATAAMVGIMATICLALLGLIGAVAFVFEIAH